VGEPLWADRVLTDLIDHPTTLPKVWGLLGWNIYVNDQAATVTLPAHESGMDSHGVVTALRWHRDGGRVNLEVGWPAPRLGVKVGFFVSDTSAPGRGNLHLVPGSHRWPVEQIDRDEVAHRAIPVCLPVGGAVLFDRRILHSATINTSMLTRRAVFYGHTYRWMRSMGERAPSARRFGPDPIRLQLLGAGSGYGRFFPGRSDVPLRSWLAANDAEGIANPR